MRYCDAFHGRLYDDKDKGLIPETLHCLSITTLLPTIITRTNVCFCFFLIICRVVYYCFTLTYPKSS